MWIIETNVHDAVWWVNNSGRKSYVLTENIKCHRRQTKPLWLIGIGKRRQTSSFKWAQPVAKVAVER
jgi:hypothetical protein